MNIQLFDEDDKAVSPQGMTVNEVGRRGGQATKAKYGSDFFRKIGRKGGRAMRKRAFGTDFYKELGKKGGSANRDKQGSDYYSKIGKKGGDALAAQVKGTDYYAKISRKGGWSAYKKAVAAKAAEVEE